MSIEDIMQNYGGIISRNQTYIKYIPIFEAVNKLTKENKPLIIAIEGRCGSGKSFLAALLAEVFVCNVFHMDDFFLPFEMKTTERLAQPGGNVHYERFQTEVLRPLQNREEVTYRPYLCGVKKLGEPILKRNGEEMLQNFLNKWIPIEEHYFSALGVQEQCDLVFDTTFLW